METVGEQYRIVRREDLTDQTYLVEVRYPELARVVRPGQFVVVMSHPEGERIPEPFADVIGRALAKAPEERFPCAVEMLEAWRAAQRRGARPARAGERVSP